MMGYYSLMKIIGILGTKNSGKDTVGQYFSEQYGYTPISFADSLKDCLASIFGWEREMLEGRTPKSRAWRERVDPWWAEHLQMPDFTPRVAMTRFGTDLMRNHFSDEIWMLNTERKIEQAGGMVTLTDVRFPNEFDMIERLGGTSIRVERGTDTDWYNQARWMLTLYDNDPTREQIDTFNKIHGVHESEWYLANRRTDYTIANNADIPSLYQQCEVIARKLDLPIDRA